MTREEHYEIIKKLFSDNKRLLLTLPTGFGKTKFSLELMQEFNESSSLNLFEKEVQVLIVVPRLVLFKTWKDEMDKWNFPQEFKVTFTTYVSFPKHNDRFWDFIIFDEGHHFTETCADAFETFRYNRVIFMSATFPKEQKFRIRRAAHQIAEYVVTARKAIVDEILPDPKVLLIPLMLDNVAIDQIYIKNKSRKTQPIVCYYKDRWSYINVKNRPIHIRCTQQQYYNEISEIINWWKGQYMETQEPFKKNLWLRAAKDRLDWLAVQKENVVKNILRKLENYRTLTFCTSIEQTENLGQYCINSKNKQSKEYLRAFNDGEINHITSCNVLNEGVNLTDCQIAIYANVGSSEIIEIQRLGRALRHKHPVIIIPFFVATREQEIVEKMLNNYNPKLVRKAFVSQLTQEKLNKFINDTSESCS